MVEIFYIAYDQWVTSVKQKIWETQVDSVGEDSDSLTMIDKINRLEKLGILRSRDLWTNMRQLRNHLAHEYPEHPEIMAKYLNQTMDAVPHLFDCLNKITWAFQKLDEQME